MLVLKRRRSKRKMLTAAQADAVEPVPGSVEAERFFDVLNRDQRTIVTISRSGERHGADKPPFFRHSFSGKNICVLERSKIASANLHVRSFAISDSDSAIDRFVRKIKSRSWSSRRTFVGLISRLSEIFIVGICLLTVIRVPTAMSAPSTRHAKATEQIRSREPQHPHSISEDDLSYVYPCGISREENMNDAYYHPDSKESDRVILNHILTRTKNALSYAESFKEKYVEKMFHLRYQEYLNLSEKHEYEWLPNERSGIPKKLGRVIDPLHLKNHTFEEFLVKIYEYLQIYAVALEQVVLDQEITRGEFEDNFRITEIELKNVLCEIREAMMEKKVAPKGQVPRSIMPDHVRRPNGHPPENSFRNMRDWSIFRDFINCLEYVIQVFEGLQKSADESSADDAS